MARYRVGIVIPALNEEKTIDRVVSCASPYGQVIVVNDGSSDETGKIAGDAGATVVQHKRNEGYDQALNSGFDQAVKQGCDYVITMDADGQHDPSILKLFIQAIDAGADVVIGTRDRFQRLAEYVFSWIAYMKWGIYDPLCGMKAYRLDIYRHLGHFDSYHSIGTELAIYAAKEKKCITQVPVKTRDRVDTPRFGKKYSANIQILRALWIGLFSYSK